MGGLSRANTGKVGVDSLLGCEIVDLEGRLIGELHDIVLDVVSGRITHVFIAMNKPRYADQRVLAPWDALQVEPGARRLRLTLRTDSNERNERERIIPRGPAIRRFAND